MVLHLVRHVAASAVRRTQDAHIAAAPDAHMWRLPSRKALQQNLGVLCCPVHSLRTDWASHCALCTCSGGFWGRSGHGICARNLRPRGAAAQRRHITSDTPTFGQAGAALPRDSDGRAHIRPTPCQMLRSRTARTNPRAEVLQRSVLAHRGGRQKRPGNVCCHSAHKS
jgi:hypothetical protein